LDYTYFFKEKEASREKLSKALKGRPLPRKISDCDEFREAIKKLRKDLDDYKSQHNFVFPPNQEP
jgi:hypothetical protein